MAIPIHRRRALVAIFCLTAGAQLGCVPAGVGIWASLSSSGSSGRSVGGASASPGPTTSAPSQVMAVADQSSVTLTWKDGGAEEAYRVERRVRPVSDWTLVATLAADSNKYTDPLTLREGEVEYRILGVAPAGVYPSSPVLVRLPPLAPDPGSASASFDAVRLFWLDRSGVETSYSIARRVAGTGAFVTVASLPPNVVQYDDRGLGLDTVYEYRIVANLVDASSSPLFLTSTTAPTQPGAFSVATVATRTVVHWQDSASTETGYRLERRSGGSAYSVLGTLPAGATSFQDVLVNPGGAYTYRLFALNGAGDGPAAGPTTVLTPPILTGFSPDTAALSGGTLMSLTGSGLGPAMTPELGGASCTDPAYLSSATMTCRTPALSDVGPQPLEVTFSGGARAVGSVFVEGQLPTRPVSLLTRQQAVPQTVIDENGTIHVIQIRARTTGSGSTQLGEVLFSSSSDRGATWSTPVTITRDATSKPYSPVLAQEGATLLAAWEDRRAGQFDTDIYLARSIDAGLTWSIPVRVNDDPGSAQQISPSIAMDQGVAILVWSDWRDTSQPGQHQDLFMVRSTDGGATWGGNVRFGPVQYEQQAPSIALEGQLALCSYDYYIGAGGDQDVYLIRSTDAGQSWGAPVKVSDAAGWHQQESKVAISSNLVLVTWEDQRRSGSTYRPDVHVRRSTDGGLTWPQASLRLTPDTLALNVGSNLALRGSLAVVAWQSSPSPGGIRISADGGLSWYDGGAGFGGPGTAVRDGLYTVIGEKANSGIDLFGIVGARKP